MQRWFMRWKKRRMIGCWWGKKKAFFIGPTSVSREARSRRGCGDDAAGRRRLKGVLVGVRRTNHFEVVLDLTVRGGGGTDDVVLPVQFLAMGTLFVTLSHDITVFSLFDGAATMVCDVTGQALKDDVGVRLSLVRPRHKITILVLWFGRGCHVRAEKECRRGIGRKK